jgi:hypothetical protein
LDQFTYNALETVIDLIETNSLYRGAEFLSNVKEFRALKQVYDNLENNGQRNHFIWKNATSRVSRLRNTAIGTLLQDLSGSQMTADADAKPAVPIEQAVKSFEDKMSGTNYKRPTALITPRMIEDAVKTINDLGLEPALKRRFAKLSDISVNNVLWVDNSVQGAMKDGIAGLLMQAATPPTQDVSKAIDISIDEFMKTVLPQTNSMELMVKNGHQGNFMSLTAPVHADSGKLFKWGNDFAWSYDGNITDSIKERVKAAGGNTNAVMRVSLAWFNHDDLDIHAIEPNGYKIYFGNRGIKSGGNKGCLDVDMNAGRGTTREPVENIVWDTPQDGEYTILVNNFAKREPSNSGFTIEVENNGAVHQFSISQSPADKATKLVLRLQVKDRVIIKINAEEGVVGGSFSQEKWGVATEKFIKVNTLMKSPNYWDNNSVGNKHWFFILEGCCNPDATRGIYNEFLSNELEKHRKVFEVLGDKTKCPPVWLGDQLSGVGFSSTRNDSVVVKVSGEKIRQIYNITF